MAGIIFFAFCCVLAHSAIAQTVTVTAPNGGENWTAGTTHSITWSGTGSSANMAYYKIALSTDGGVTWPAAGTANDLTPNGLYTPSARSFSWTIGSALNTSQARIRVRALDSGGNILVADTSDANFTISPPVVLPTVTVTAPNGGENWTAGTTHSITWSGTGSSANMAYYKIALSTDGGVTWPAAGTANDLTPNGIYDPSARSFSWTIGSALNTSQARIRVRALDSGGNILVADTSDANFTISPPVVLPTVTVAAPNGGENWTAGTTHSITWSGTGSSANMAYYKIALSTDGGVTWPAAGTANDLTPNGIYDPSARSYSWTIGSTLNTSQARIRVRALDSGGNILVSDTSDANFTISPPVVLPTVTVTAPNGGENWTAGTTHSITWSGTGSSANMAYYKIALSTDGGVTWPAAGTANDLTPNGIYDPSARSFSWTIGSTLNTTQARIRVRALDSGGNILVSDTSDANFTISPPVVLPTVTVTAPNGGENWTAGTTHSITWSGTGSSANMAYYKVALSTDGGVTWPVAGTANDLTPNGIYDPSARSFSWTIGSTLNTTQARIRVRALDSGGNILVDDTSDANFTISPPVVLPTVTVTAPNGGENWTAGTTHSITWSGTGSSANMAYYKVALSTDGGVTWPAAGTANDLTPNGIYDPSARSFSWTIGSSLNTSQARIRVRALDSGGNILVADTSDANFTISPPVVLPTVTVTAPNGGENWTAGTTHSITWSGTGSSANMAYFKIALSTDGGVTWPAAGTANDLTPNGIYDPSARSFSWTIGSALNTTQARIRVRALDSGGNILAENIEPGNFTIANPAPTVTISSVSPSPVTGANTIKTLTVNGSGFVSGATVRLRSPVFGVDSTRSATVISSGQLQITATFGTDPSSWTAQVVNPDSSYSSEFAFTVQAPPPVIQSVSPSSTAAGGAGFTLRVNGNTFHQASVVRWNGANRTTTPIVSAGGLTTALDAQISAADIASAGTATVTVYSPGPGGGTSAWMTFAIGSTPGQPNLVPQNVTLSSYSVQSGNQVTITWTIANTGGGNCGASVTGLRLGQSPTIHPTSDYSFNNSFPTPAINAGLSVQQSTTVTIPANTAAGTYYVWVVADNVANSTLNQTSKTDDYAHSTALTVTTGPALQGEPASLGVLWNPAYNGNYGNRPANQVIDTIVIHTSEGRDAAHPNLTYQESYTGAISWFKNPASGVSAHYCISPSGEITQMVALNDRAYHATYYNSRSVGIEMAGFANDQGTWQQPNSANLVALTKLVTYLVTKYNIQVVHPSGDANSYPDYWFTETGIVAHQQIQAPPAYPRTVDGNTYNDKYDPGIHFPWPSFIQDVQASVNATRFATASGADSQPLTTGQFQILVSTSSEQPVTVQASDDTVNWTDVATVNTLEGKSVFTDMDAGAHTKRFYRPKP